MDTFLSNELALQLAEILRNNSELTILREHILDVLDTYEGNEIEISILAPEIQPLIDFLVDYHDFYPLRAELQDALSDLV